MEDSREGVSRKGVLSEKLLKPNAFECWSNQSKTTTFSRRNDSDITLSDVMSENTLSNK
jgi:hypothetical protein